MKTLRFLAAVLLPLLVATTALAAPKARLWERWTAYDADSVITVDHSAWDGFLSKYLKIDSSGVNLVPYAKVSPGDRRALEGYVDMLAGVKVGALNRDEQRAYWINLYNALTIKVVLEHYPVDSIKDIDISPGWFSFGPWDAKLVKVEGEEVSLNDIEHRILRPIWKDPRIHYAVNCASMGCPNLKREAYTAANTGELLESGARDYINHPRGADFYGHGKLRVSSIYVWFQEDFGSSDKGVIEHLKKYAEPGLKQSLENVKGISDDKYDWSLNDAK